MKNIIRYFILGILTLFFTVPAFSNVTEAASVALLPLVNNVENNDLASQVYYKEALNVLKNKKGFVVIENDKLNSAIEAAKIENTLPNQATLAQIAKDGDVDIVIAMQLDTIDYKFFAHKQDRFYKLNLTGSAIAYNRLNGAFYNHNFTNDKKISVALTSRFDWTHEEWGRQVRLEIDRALRAK